MGKSLAEMVIDLANLKATKKDYNKDINKQIKEMQKEIERVAKEEEE